MKDKVQSTNVKPSPQQLEEMLKLAEKLFK